MSPGVGVPQEWIEGPEYGTAFISNQSFYHVTDSSVVKSKAPKYRGSAGRNKIRSITSVYDKVISLSEDDSINVLVKDEEDKQKPSSMIFCLGHICPDCGAVSRDSLNYKKHKRSHGELVKCPKCPPETQAMDKLTLREHMKVCVIKCPYDGCNAVIQTRSRLSGHIGKHMRSLA